MADSLADALARSYARARTADAYAAAVTPQQAQQVGAYATMYPHIGGVAVPLGLSGLDPVSPTARRAAEAKVELDKTTVRWGVKTTGGVFGAMWGGIKKAAGAVGEVTKPIVRYGSAGAIAPLEMVQAAARSGAAAFGVGDSDVSGSWLSGTRSTQLLKQTTVGAGIAEAHDKGILGESLLDVVTPGTKDESLAGGGWFISPDSKTGQRQVAEARAANTIDGRAFTLGRGLASATPLEPGTFGYKALSGVVDFTAALTLDPMTYAGGSLAKANRAKNLFDRGKLVEVELPTTVRREAGVVPIMEAGPEGISRVFIAENAGMVEGVPRKTALPEVAAKWLNSTKRGGGNRTAEKIAEIGDFNTLWRATSKKLPVELVADLVKANDPVTVKNLLAEAIADGKARELIQLRVRKPPARLAGMMPGAQFDLDDVDDLVEQADRVGRNAKLPEHVISKHNMALAEAASKGEKFDVLRELMSSVKDSLKGHGMSEMDASFVTKMFTEQRDAESLYFVEAIADGVTQQGVKIAGVDTPLVGPHLPSELINRHVPIPNSRDIKTASREADWLRYVQQSGLYEVSADLLDFGTQSVFKPFALALRPAWTVRVVGEEQVRMGAGDYASIFHHPLSYIAWLAGDTPDSKLTKLLHVKARGGADITGARFEDEDLVKGMSPFKQSLSADAGGWTDTVVSAQARHRFAAGKQDKEHLDGWHHELIKYASDPVTREVARDPTRAKELFWSGPLQSSRREMMESLVARHAEDPRNPLVDLTSRQVSDAYIDSVAHRVQVMTSGHSDLINAVSTGRVSGHTLTDGLKPSKAAKDELAKYQQEFAPEVVQALRTGKGPEANTMKMAENYERGVQFMFRHLMTIPTNKLSRSKVFKQAYYRRVEETLPLMDNQARIQAVRAAKAAGLDRATIKRWRETVAAQTVPGRLTLENADVVAKHYGLQQTRKLLYSLHEKSQAADALRVVFPFGEAWREVLTRWAKLGTENPLVPYRTTQGIQAAEEAGFFYPDPQTGQEMYSIPGYEWVTEKLVGVPQKGASPVSGLNMFGQVIPGVGPAVTVTAAKFMPDDPSLDFVRDQLMPFGDPDTGGGALETMLPSYVRKLMTAFGVHPSDTQRRQLASTTQDVMAYLASTGDYDLADPASQQALLDDAKSKAKYLFIIRAMAQSSFPSSPIPQMQALDKDGRVTALYKMQADYRKMQADDYKTATERFLKKYGDFAFLVTIPKTESTTTFDAGENANRFARENPDQAKRFPNTFGLFAPGGEFDQAEYQRQIEAGTRESRTPAQVVELANIRIANAIYQQAKAQVGPNPAPNQTAYLRALREQLSAKYPGYTGMPNNLAKGEATINELERAVKDPVLSATDAGRGLVAYLALRDEAQRSAVAGGLAGFQQAKSAANIRRWLATEARSVVADHPAFADMWERVFSREVEEG